MKLLLVDDEEYVIESIKRNLDLTETWQRYCRSLAKRILCRATSGAGKIRFRSMSGIPGIW